MDTWSSWLADVGRLVTLLGLARHWFSAARAAAVTWAIMKPEFTPLSLMRKAGRPERPGSSSKDRRRSEMAPISDTASAMMSATKAMGSAWKLPPEMTSPLLNTSGLSDAAFASMARTRAACCRLSRHAPITCGTQRIEYGSCTRPQCGCEGSMALPSSSARTAAATAICPTWPRASWMRASNGLTEPLMASRDRHPATRAAANTSSAPNRPASASEVDTCVPLSSASPSLGPRTKGAKPTAAMASLPETIFSLTLAWPSPISTHAMCASGARSPEAPTEPLAGITGSTLALASASRASAISGRMPECPRARLTALVARISRTTASGSASPVPTLCESTRLRCSSARRSWAIFVLASLPKPVLMP